MSLSTDIKTVLEADSALTTLLEGGIYDFDETGRMGIGYTSTPDAYDGPILLPCALVKARQKYASKDIRDPQVPITSFTQIVEIYLYQENGFDDIEQAQNLIFELLHDQHFDFGVMQFAGTFEGRQAEELNGASMNRIDFQRFALMQP